jgi:hypothetical protein
MKEIFLFIHRPLSAKTSRNEKILSRISLFEKNDYKTNNIVINYNKNPFTFILNLIIILFRVINITINSSDNTKIIVWTMNSPSYLHVPGLILKSLKNEVYWLAEFRDAMCEQPFYERKPLFTKILNRFLETYIVKNADIILKGKGSQCSNEYFRSKYPTEVDKFIETGYQGYDKTLFNLINAKHYDCFTITYAGRFYKNWIEPQKFLRAFADFVKINNLEPEDIQFRVYTKGWVEEYEQLVENLNLKDYLKINNYVSIKEIIAILKGSNLLLYINGSNKTTRDMINSKFWNYIGSGKPILVLSKEGFDICSIVRKYNLGYIAEEYNIEDIIEKINLAYTQSFTGYKNVNEISELFSRDHRNQILIKILDNIQ